MRALKAGKYLFLQLKRVMRCFPAVFGLTLLLLGAVALVGRGVLERESTGEKSRVIQVGIVGDITDTYLGIGIFALEQLDPSRYAIEIHEMTEAEARKGLQSGELTAYFYVPDGFVDSIVTGENLQVDFYTANGQAGLGTVMMNEFAGVVSDLVLKSQGAIYGLQSYCRANGLEEIFWEATDELNLLCIDYVLSRTMIHEVEILGVSRQLSTAGYYVCGLTVLFLMIWGVNGCQLFIRRDQSMAKLLAADGRGAFWQIISEYLAYFVLMAASFLGVAVLAGLVSEEYTLTLAEWSYVDFPRIISFALGLLPVAAMLTALALLGHELVSDIVSGILLQFLGAVAMGYVAGCFYPASFFPEGIRLVGEILPAGIGVRYASECMREEVSFLTVAVLILYTGLFLLGAYVLRRKKLLVE